MKNHKQKETVEEKYSYQDLLHENEKASVDRQEPMAEKNETPADPPPVGDLPSDQSIRVLLKTDGFSDYYHSSIKIEAQGSYKLSGSEEIAIADGEQLEITSESTYFKDNCLQIVPESPDHSITLLSLNREQGQPSYQGSLTIYKDEKGLRIVNELPLEQYLYAVVPSEMPTSYEEEALKAQAVCARTYAFVQIKDDKLSELGAQVDDSVSFQVYNNVAPNDKTTQAVNDTKNEILCKDGNPIDAYYFSTSHGKTSTDEVWEASVPAAYLKSVSCEYDQGEPWYRWEVTFSREEMIKRIQKKYPGIEGLDSIGVTKVGEGEAVLAMEIKSAEQTVSVTNEYEIRELFSPKGLTITRQDGSTVDGSTLLPSAYFTLEEHVEQDLVTGYTFHGGGYGHGVGLSQNGAQNMARGGEGYQAILNYFYNEVQIQQIGAY